MNRLLLVLAISCDAGMPTPAPTTPPPAPPSPAPLPAPVVLASSVVTAQGHQYAIVRLHSVRPELCTNMGGTDWSFSVEGMPADFQLHGGGHGIFGKGSALAGMDELAEDDASWRDRYYVAEVTLASHGRIERRILCDNERVMYDGTVLAVAPARDLEDARAQLAAAPGKGLPAAVRIDRWGR